jgi:hypothetical protein
MHLANLQRQIDLAKRMHAAEALRYAGHLQESRQGFVLQWDCLSNDRLDEDRIPDRRGRECGSKSRLVPVWS